MTAMLDFPLQRRLRLKPRTNTSRLIMSSLERSYEYHESVLLAEFREPESFIRFGGEILKEGSKARSTINISSPNVDIT